MFFRLPIFFATDVSAACKVNDFLESTDTPGVFAVGDCAHMVNHPRPKAGVFAVRQVIPPNSRPNTTNSPNID